VQEQRRTQVTRAIPDRHHSQLAPLRDAIKSDTLSALPESGRRPIEGGIFDPASDGLRRRRPLFASCGASFAVRSTAEAISTDVCSNCHPAYTGRERAVASGSRIARFNRRRALAAA
jgi:large subunit ribosomal protein L31